MRPVTPLLALALICALPVTAEAHRPRLQDCQEFAKVAQDTAEARDHGRPLEASMDALTASQKLHYGGHYSTYSSLVADVYSDPELSQESPVKVRAAAMQSCQKFNANELATMHDD